MSIETRVIRFLVTDVDGTLVTPDKVVTPAARDAVHRLKDAGIGFAFVSSRPPRGLVSIADALGFVAHAGERGPAAAAFNGGALLDASLKPLAFTAMEDDDARIALACLASLKIDAWVFTLDEWLVLDSHTHYVPRETHTVGFAPRVVDTFEGVTGIGKIVGSSGDPDTLRRAGVALEERLSPRTRAHLSQTYYLDITHVDANKGSALRAIAEAANIPLAEMAAIGDMANDLAMLEIAGFSIAMGNAPDDVKAATDAVTASDRDDGFAKAVHELILPRGPGGRP